MPKTVQATDQPALLQPAPQPVLSGRDHAAPYLEDPAGPLRVPLGMDEIDAALDPDTQGGIIANALHEVRVETCLDAASGAGFSLCLGLLMARGIAASRHAAGRISGPGAVETLPVFWISDAFVRAEYGAFYGPGLSAFNLDPEDLIRVFPRTRREALWAAGEIVSAKNAVGFCLVEIRGNPAEMDLTTTRRLMLRARTSCTPVIILRQSGFEEASAAATRWHISPAVSRQDRQQPYRTLLGPPSFSVHLEKCRGGRITGKNPWKIEWNANDQRLVLLNPANDVAANPAGGSSNRAIGKNAFVRRAASPALPFGSPAAIAN